ncbi:SidA/IucD/PvdA family monooxygenase [Segnochrobactraceae bacterium EtOH-i3]
MPVPASFAVPRGLRPPHPIPRRPDWRDRIAALNARVHHDLQIMVYPKDDWVLPRTGPAGEPVYDVAIIGGGQSGLSIAYALRKEHVGNVIILDQSPKGREGPWITYSRMWTLRSPKHLTGPDLGMPSLAPRSWFEAVYGEDGWDELVRWPRLDWQDYLDWYRDVLDLPVVNDARVDTIEEDPAGVRLSVNCDPATGEPGRTVLARRLVLATGIEGMGGWWVPPFVKDKLPPSRWTLCTDSVDSADWAGQRIGLIGAGATGWDRAADLLEQGAASVTMYMRRNEVLYANAFRYLEKAGFLRHYASLPDADKWRWMTSIFRFGQPPTQDGLNRCAAFDSFTLHAGATWADCREVDGEIEIVGSDGSLDRFDHLFIGCGFSMDAHFRPELAPFADQIALWRDVVPEARAEAGKEWLAEWPYLDTDLTFTERTPGAAPILKKIHCFNYGATMNNAHSGASLSGMRYGMEPLIHGLTRALWDADDAAHFRITDAWNEIDTDPAPIRARIRRIRAAE